MAEEIKVRVGSVVSLRYSGCCYSHSHSGYGVVYLRGDLKLLEASEQSEDLSIFYVKQGGQYNGYDCHNRFCIDKVIRY